MEEPVVVRSGEGQQVMAGPNRVTVVVPAGRTGGDLGVVEYEVGPLFTAPATLHHHTRESWTCRVLEGSLTFQFATGTVEAPAGTTVFVPRGVDFTWRNDRAEPARYLALYQPGGFEQFFVEAAERVSTLGGDAGDPARTREAVLPLWERYGIEEAPRPEPQPEPQPEPAAAMSTSVPPPAGPPAGWYADPTGRATHRYWDGQRWTEHVARDGVTSTDPLNQ